MRSLLTIAILIASMLSLHAQFAPPAGQPGSTAIPYNSELFVAWATHSELIRGWQDIADTSLGKTTVGDEFSAVGTAGDNAIVSLGDAGLSILSFDKPITNGPGPDFAVFENSFSDDFLELAFVEVSSDGVNYIRFPAVSLTQTNNPVGSFGLLDATKLHNLAGKYRGLYGVPFDLEELIDSNIDITRITHVKIIDVVGSLAEGHSSYDSQGNKINEPYPTPYPSGGFDLDAVGVIHELSVSSVSSFEFRVSSIYPNPTSAGSVIRGFALDDVMSLHGSDGSLLLNESLSRDSWSVPEWLNPGTYILSVKSDLNTYQQKLIILP